METVTLLEFAISKGQYNKAELLDVYCPSIINELEKFFPYKRHKVYKDDCQYRFNDNKEECKKCWNRKLIVK